MSGNNVVIRVQDVTRDLPLGKTVIHALRGVSMEIHQGEMVGIVSIGDAVSARLKELAAEKEALTGMIMGN